MFIPPKPDYKFYDFGVITVKRYFEEFLKAPSKRFSAMYGILVLVLIIVLPFFVNSYPTPSQTGVYSRLASRSEQVFSDKSYDICSDAYSYGTGRFLSTTPATQHSVEPAWNPREHVYTCPQRSASQLTADMLDQVQGTSAYMLGRATALGHGFLDINILNTSPDKTLHFSLGTQTLLYFSYAPSIRETQTDQACIYYELYNGVFLNCSQKVSTFYQKIQDIYTSVGVPGVGQLFGPHAPPLLPMGDFCFTTHTTATQFFDGLAVTVPYRKSVIPLIKVSGGSSEFLANVLEYINTEYTEDEFRQIIHVASMIGPLITNSNELEETKRCAYVHMTTVPDNEIHVLRDNMASPVLNTIFSHVKRTLTEIYDCTHESLNEITFEVRSNDTAASGFDENKFICRHNCFAPPYTSSGWSVSRMYGSFGTYVASKMLEKTECQFANNDEYALRASKIAEGGQDIDEFVYGYTNLYAGNRQARGVVNFNVRALGDLAGC